MNETRIAIHKQLLEQGEKYSNNLPFISNDHFYSNRALIKSPLLDFDFSKQRINDEALDFLLKVPESLDVRDRVKKLLNGEIVNPSENSPVTHTTYRNSNSENISKHIHVERERIKSFLENQLILGSFKNLVCISIGGSRLGSELLNEFQSKNGSLIVHFCSSHDLLEVKDILNNCKQSETLIFVSSRSFETSEIVKNLGFIKTWFEETPDIEFKNQLYGISSNASAMSSYGIKESNQFIILDSLVGRFSVWSSMSIPAFVNSGFEDYNEFLEGANLADQHTVNSPWEENIPALMALLSIWNSNSLNINNHGIFTYNFRLRSLTKYLAQLTMESNGKSINYDSEMSPFCTSPLIWGGYGIESQHSTFQWLMQGKIKTSCDFIAVNDGTSDFIDSHEVLLSQIIAMTQGVEDKQSPFKTIKGNNPCSILQMNTFNLKALGFLLAIYEHKVFIEALILGIDPFDQWGVELGKELSLNIKNDSEFLKKYFLPSILPKT